MKTSTYLSASAFLVGLCGLGNALISMGTTRWRYNVNTAREYGLFETCTGRREGCEISINSESAGVKSTASFMVIGSAFLLAGLFSSLVAIFKGKAHCWATFFHVSGGLLLLIGPAVYTGIVRSENDTQIDFGFSIWLAWASVAISLVSGIIQGLGIPKSSKV